MTFVIDIDNTLILSDKKECIACGRVKYSIKEVDQKEIDSINKAYDAGHVIILHTGRNWDCYRLTVRQLSGIGLKYNQLVMGKPQGIYIDKDAKKSITEVFNDQI